MWVEVGGDLDQSSTKVPWPQRESRLTVRKELETAGLPNPNITNYAFRESTFAA